MKTLGLVALMMVAIIAGAESTSAMERHAGYYYPESKSFETYKARAHATGIEPAKPHHLCDEFSHRSAQTPLRAGIFNLRERGAGGKTDYRQHARRRLRHFVSGAWVARPAAVDRAGLPVVQKT